jgi:predicted amidophosphoribosyltransferase
MREEDILKLYNKGLSDEEISKSLGISIWTVRYWRRKYGYKPNPHLRKCPICERYFRDFGKKKYCSECREELRKIRGLRFQIIKKIRYHLYYLLDNSPEVFWRVIKEMEEEEGPEFVKLITKGMNLKSLSKTN